jgi:hypothetical protein
MVWTQAASYAAAFGLARIPSGALRFRWAVLGPSLREDSQPLAGADDAINLRCQPQSTCLANENLVSDCPDLLSIESI